MLDFLRNFGASCADYEPTLFGFPTWYKYLIDSGKIVAADCSLLLDKSNPNHFTLYDIWFIVLAVIEMMLYVAGIIAVVMIMWGGFRLITSQGSPDTIKEGRNTILYACIGLVVSISARAVMNIVTGVF